MSVLASHPNPERVPQVFDGVEYGQRHGQVFKHVESRNCPGEPNSRPHNP